MSTIPIKNQQKMYIMSNKIRKNTVAVLLIFKLLYIRFYYQIKEDVRTWDSCRKNMGLHINKKMDFRKQYINNISTHIVLSSHILTTNLHYFAKMPSTDIYKFP